MIDPPRIVLDTNVLLRGVLNPHSPAGRIVDACDRRTAILLLSRPILAEYGYVLAQPKIVQRYPELAKERTSLLLRRLRYVAEAFRDIRSRFDFPRDPRDSMFIELAIAARATHLVTADEDLLSLESSHSDAANRFRQRARRTRIVGPTAFLDELRLSER